MIKARSPFAIGCLQAKRSVFAKGLFSTNKCLLRRFDYLIKMIEMDNAESTNPIIV